MPPAERNSSNASSNGPRASICAADHGQLIKLVARGDQTQANADQGEERGAIQPGIESESAADAKNDAHHN